MTSLNSLEKITRTSTLEYSYRESKLTRLLTDTLSGNSKSWICTNVAPITAHCEETTSTLQFATRAMRVKVNATVNERPTAVLGIDEYEVIKSLNLLKNSIEWEQINKLANDKIFNLIDQNEKDSLVVKRGG